MWRDKVVVVAGGSKGLGFHVASEFCERGGLVVILARTQSAIEQAVQDIKSRIAGANVSGRTVDLSVDADRRRVICEIASEMNKVDVWINAVGQSTRTSFSEAKLDDYRKLMEQNFFVSVGCSLDVLKHLEQSSGFLVNIGSLASKTGWRYVAPYVTSKHALAGFAHQLRIEGPSNVKTLFVCPGPIADSDIGRYAEKASGLSDAAAKRGAGAPVKAIDPQQLAKKIINSCERGKTELVIPVKSRILFSTLQLWPWLGDRLIKRFCK